MDTRQAGRVDAWERWDWLWTVIFYGSILVSVLVVWQDGDRTTPLWIPLLLSAGLVLWHWGGLRLAYRNVTRWDEQALPRFIVLTGDIVITFVLINISPAFYFVLFGLFSQIFRHLPLRYAIAASFLATAAIIYAQVTEDGQAFSFDDPRILIFLALGLAGIALGVWVTAIIGQSTRRRELIEQLEAAQADLAAAERREGVLEERQRLAREIHDTLAQGFTSIVMHLEAAEQALPDDLPTLSRHLDRARETARFNLDEARRVVQDLRPDLLEEHSLPDAIQRAAARWSEETGIPVATNTTGNVVAVHPDIEIVLLRATQEALNNVRKHARATAVQLTLSYMDDVVILDVADDGQGLVNAEPAAFAGGYGLEAMQERAAQVGGSVIVESEPGEGTTVVVSVPVVA